MDLLSTFFLILIVLMSGGIAVLADDLGRRLGKKRLHFKGLRPKRVAQIGTFLAGVVVSLMTILIVAIASSQVRQWLREGAHAIEARNDAIRSRDEAVKSKDEALRAVATANTDLRKARTQFASLERTKGNLDKEVKAKTDEIARQKQQLAGLQNQIKTLTPRIASLQARVHTAEMRVTGADLRIKTLDKQLAERKKRLAQLESNLKGALVQLGNATKQKADVDDQNIKLLHDNIELEKKRDELTASNLELQKQRDDLETARDKAQADLVLARDDLNDTQASLTVVRRQLDATSNELRSAQNDLEQARRLQLVTRSAPMIYRMGEEVTRISVEPGLSVRNAENALASLLRAARVAALKEGAQPNGQAPEAGIFNHEISADDIKRQIVAKIAGATEATALVAYSSINAFKGEPVSLEVVPYSNPLIYRQGAVVAETRIDGRKDAAAIFHQISNLGALVQEQAKKDKMIPRTGSDEPYGAVSSEEVLKLVSDVKASDRQVRVKAIAIEDIRAGDPLKLSFVIR